MSKRTQCIGCGVSCLVSGGSNENCRDDALITAVKQNDTVSIKTLLLEGADVNFTPSEADGLTPLLVAMDNHDLVIVQLLLEKGADVNLGIRRRTPFSRLLDLKNRMKESAFNGLFDLFVAHGLCGKPAINIALFEAIRYGNREVVERLIDEGADIDFQLHEKYPSGPCVPELEMKPLTPLLLSLRCNKQVLATLLVNKGANVKPEGARKPMSVFAGNVTPADLDLIELMLDKGAMVDKNEQYAREMLFLAIDNDKTAMFSTLLRQGVTITENGWTEKAHAECAWQHRNVAMVTFFINNNVIDIKKKDDQGRSVLFLTCEDHIDDNHHLLDTPLSAEQMRERCQGFVKSLIDKGADVNEKDHTGNTPLLWACATRNAHLAEALIRNHAPLNERDKFNQTALVYARKWWGKEGISDMLLKKGATL